MACEDNNTYVLTFGERFTEKDEESGTETAYYYAMLSGVGCDLPGNGRKHGLGDNNAHPTLPPSWFSALTSGM